MTQPNWSGKAEGMEAALAGVTDEWKAMAMMAVQDCTRLYESFTTDEVWGILESAGMERPETPAAMGPIMRNCARNGIIQKTPFYRVSTQRTNHAREVAIWSSVRN